MSHLKVKDLMSRDTVIIEPDQTLADASLRMKETGCGILPVGVSPERIEGVITDRDIAVRGVALGYIETLLRQRFAADLRQCRLIALQKSVKEHRG